MATQKTQALRPSPETQTSLVKYVDSCLLFLNNNFNIRQMLLDRDRAYAREKDMSAQQARARAANDNGVPTQVQNVTVPVVMPQVDSAAAYLTNTFLSSYPIFPVVSKPSKLQEALMMETLIGEHSVKFGWIPELLLCLFDGLKYNLMAAEVSWKNKKIWTVLDDPETAIKTGQGRAEETYFQGNAIKRLNPYNLIMDTRLADPCKMHLEGEFAGYTELMSRVALKQLIADLGAEVTMNAKEAFQSGTGVYSSTAGDAAFYLPQVNPKALLQDGMTNHNWLLWAGVETKERIRYSDMYEVTTLYCRVIPSDFGLSVSAPNTVQIYKLIVVNRKVLICAERQSNAHSMLPIVIGQPTEDGLGWQTKSFAENTIPLQDIASALYNSAIESQRRKVYDRMLYDPSRIRKQDIDNVSPVARIPVKQSGYGSNLSEAIYSVPYRDEGIAAILQMSRDVMEMANVTNGQNRVQQGQFQKGNKTRHEFQDVMDHSNGRQVMMAIRLEYRFFQPIKEMIKVNIYQFQPPTTLYNRNTKEPVKINPAEIRQASLEFQMADGVLPVDKLLNLEMFGQVVPLVQAVPQFGAEYDIMGMLTYYMAMNGAHWINDFKRTPDQAQQFLTQQQQLAGNTPQQLAAGKQPAMPQQPSM